MRSDAVANQERVLAAAVTAVLREGHQVPMGTIAAEAGVGIGTLYRRYPNREALLEALTLRAFRLVLKCAENAENLGQPGLATLSSFLDCVISHADQLVLPLHGGPIPTAPETLAVRSQRPPGAPAHPRPRPARRHDPRGRHRARHHRLGRAAGTAAAERRRPGPGTQAAEGLLPRRPRSPRPLKERSPEAKPRSRSG